MYNGKEINLIITQNSKEINDLPDELIEYTKYDKFIDDEEEYEEKIKTMIGKKYYCMIYGGLVKFCFSIDDKLFGEINFEEYKKGIDIAMNFIGIEYVDTFEKTFI